MTVKGPLHTPERYDEIERLRAENERLEANRKSARAALELCEQNYERLEAENERLTTQATEDANHAAEIIRDYHADMFKLVAENKRLREALNFYAQQDNYEAGYISGERMRFDVEIDDGERARAALQSKGD